jgi:hypothetical protein
MKLAADEDVVHHVLERANHDVQQLKLLRHLQRQLLVGEELRRRQKTFLYRRRRSRDRFVELKLVLSCCFLGV